MILLDPRSGLVKETKIKLSGRVTFRALTQQPLVTIGYNLAITHPPMWNIGIGFRN